MIKDIEKANEEVKANDREMLVLKESSPGCFDKDGKFDIEKFSNLLKDKVDITKEGYELNFLGKSYAKLLVSMGTTTVLKPRPEHNERPENKKSENVYIIGDNLDGLKHLLKSFSRKVRCIYIDPPYNTGSDDFVYADNFNFTIKELEERLSMSEEQAQRVLDLTKRNSSSHSAWLTFMFPRLMLARDLITDDGIIFISIDDNEQANLKLICNDIFGEENCLGCIVRSTGQTTGQDSGGLGSSFDYVLVYGKVPDIDLEGLPLTDHDLKRFENEDENGKYAYDQLRKTGSSDRREDRPNMFYAIKDPDGNDLFPIAPAGYESRWRVEQKTYDRLVEEGYILWKKTKRNGNEIWWPYVKYYLEGRTKRPSPLWTDLEGNKKATRDVRTLFNGVKVFDTAKPVDLIKRLLSIAPHSSKHDLILDFFSGSATTAHAVLQLNAEDGGNRKYVMVQLNEKCKENSEALGAGYRTIDQIGIERIIRSGEKIKKETGADIDYGFKIYEIFEPRQETLDKIEEFDPNSLYTDGSILQDFGRATVLTTWAIRDGYGFNAKIEELDIAGYTAYHCCKHLYLINPDFTEDAVAALIERYDSDGSFNPENIVLFGYSFNQWSINEMLDKNIRLLNDSEKNLKVNIFTRY